MTSLEVAHLTGDLSYSFKEGNNILSSGRFMGELTDRAEELHSCAVTTTWSLQYHLSLKVHGCEGDARRTFWLVPGSAATRPPLVWTRIPRGYEKLRMSVIYYELQQNDLLSAALSCFQRALSGPALLESELPRSCPHGRSQPGVNTAPTLSFLGTSEKVDCPAEIPGVLCLQLLCSS